MNELNELSNIYQEFITNSDLPYEKKIDLIFLFDSTSYTFPIKALYNIILLIKNSLYPFLYNRVYLPIEKRKILSNIKSEYDSIVNEFDAIKNSAGLDDDKKTVLFSRIIKLRQSIEEFKELTPINTPIPATSNIPSNQWKSDTIISRGNVLVGDVTSAIENEANTIWREYWINKCDQHSGRNLNLCKASGVDKAINIIRFKIPKCNSTVDPVGCRNTLSNLITRWQNRKIQYMRKR